MTAANRPPVTVDARAEKLLVTRRHDRLPGPRHTRRAAMTTSDPFAYWELSMLLQGSDEPKVFCTEHIVGRTGYRIAKCTRELNHPLPSRKDVE